MTSPVEIAPRSWPVPDRALVLAARPLRAEFRLEETSRFADDAWWLTPAWLRADRKSLKLDFSTVPSPFVATAKSLFYTLLTQDTPPGELPLTIPSIRTYFSCVRRFLTWVHDRGRVLAQVSGEDLDTFHRELAEQRLSLASTYRYRRAVRMLWAYRSRIPDALVTDPLRRPAWQAWARANPRRFGENLTERIPEQIMGPLLTWALRWIDDFAEDVLAARDERAALDTRTPADPDAVSALAVLLDGYRHRRQPLPALPIGRLRRTAHPAPCLSHLARLLGHDRDRLERLDAERLIAEAAREVGVDSDCPLAHRVHGQLDGRPWLAAISYYDVPRYERLLQGACWIVIAYLSGMRDSEAKHLQRGCLSVQRDPEGRVYRHRLHSLAFKGEDAHGAQATWIVTAPVARAVAVLERFQPANQPYLFAPPLTSRSYRQRRSPFGVLDSNATNTDITDLIRWINDYCTAHQRPDGIPPERGRVPHLTTRRFRRTLAWFIARRPGGTIAGALQYRHQGIQMFEGYAGTSDSGFRDEVEAEEALARGQFLAEMGADVDRPTLAGPAGAEAGARLAEFARHTLFDGQVVTDEARLRRIVPRHDPHLYPGTFVTCVYNPDRALCRAPADTGHQPILADCQPLACRNTALTPANHNALAGHLTQLEDALEDGARLAPYVRHRLQEQHRATAAFLARHDPEPAE
ncbi:site-specific integrase [Streptomyces cinnabarinus]|uniref:Site-specific integrase n=1 Tax=Streptomyces cinnabarinus TaxID=67287 RepID=A0ABY7KQP7_9ACTN|nr:site-specific integrase [Streptomyces cinnabarinus]WAZ26897.1 site-specific integrase [Streptomyces cinnabarinus]